MISFKCVFINITTLVFPQNSLTSQIFRFLMFNLNIFLCVGMTRLKDYFTRNRTCPNLNTLDQSANLLPLTERK